LLGEADVIKRRAIQADRSNENIPFVSVKKTSNAGVLRMRSDQTAALTAAKKVAVNSRKREHTARSTHRSS
jgi:hypothetical protein